ncbi:MAG: hypothetical protein ACOYN4_13805, partial [Bacteroidales bacterium]
GGGPGCPALLNFDLLRPDIKRRYIEKHGDPKANVKHYAFRNFVADDYKAIEFFAQYMLPDGRFLPLPKQLEYANNAKVLNALVHVSNDRAALRKALGGNLRTVWPNLADVVAQLKNEIAHTLPDNAIRLKQRAAQYKESGYLSLISGKWLNNNAAKVVDPQQEATMRQLLRKHNNLDNEQIRSLYNIMAEALGWDKIAAQTVGNYRTKWELETYSGRKGGTSFENTKAMQVKRSAPGYPLYYWTADGWDVELLYQAAEMDSKGNTRTTYHNRLTVVVILDPSVKYPIGYAIGTHETPELIKAAFRNAITHTKELFGDYYKVLQLQTDRYSMKSLMPMYEAISEKFTPARAHNAKAKVIEPYFNRLNKKYCQLLPNWSGFGIATGSAKQPNTEYLNKIRHSFPDEFGCRHQISQIMEQERALLHDKYLALFGEMPADDKKPMLLDRFLYVLGETTGYTNRLSAPGLVVTLNGEKREYDTFDLGFRKHANVDWTVHFNPEETGQVLASSGDGTLRYLLTEKYVQPMALRERKDGDSEQLQLVRGYNRDVKARIIEGMTKDADCVNELFESNPRLNNTLAKLVLVDSNGQHKDNKAAARIGWTGWTGSTASTGSATGAVNVKAQKVLARQNKKIKEQEKRSWAEQQDEYLNSKLDINKYL